MDRTDPKQPRITETAGQFNARVFTQIQKLTRGAQSKLGVADKMCTEIAKRADDLEAPIRDTIISHLRYHLRTYRTLVKSMEASLMQVVQVGQDTGGPSHRIPMADTTFTPLKRGLNKDGIK